MWKCFKCHVPGLQIRFSSWYSATLLLLIRNGYEFSHIKFALISNLETLLCGSSLKFCRTIWWNSYGLQNPNLHMMVQLYHQRGRWTEINEHLYWSHIEKNCISSLYLKFDVFKWKYEFISSVLIQPYWSLNLKFRAAGTYFNMVRTVVL